MDKVEVFIQRAKPTIEKMLPEHVSYDRFERSFNTAQIANPKIMQCSDESLFQALSKCSGLGLVPDGSEATILPYGRSATLIIGVKGFIKLLMQNEDFSSINMEVVHEHDEHEYWTDEKGQHMKFAPKVFGDRGKPIGVFATAYTKSGGFYVENMPASEIMKIKKDKPNGSPWNGPYELEMWRKTAFRRLAKRLPMSIDTEKQLSSLREDAEYIRPAAAVTVQHEQGKPSQLMAAIEGKKQPKETI